MPYNFPSNEVSLEDIDLDVSKFLRALSAGCEAAKSRAGAMPDMASDDSGVYSADADTRRHAARIMISREHGFHDYVKFSSFVRLVPEVKDVIRATYTGDKGALGSLLKEHPWASMPRWNDGKTPSPIPNDSVALHHASTGPFDKTSSSEVSAELTSMLIGAGADPNVKYDGACPLSDAASFGCAPVCRALVAGGADVNSPEGDGKPLAYALRFGNTAAAKELEALGATLDLKFAAGLGNIEAMRGFFDASGRLAPDAERMVYFGSEYSPGISDDEILARALTFAGMNGQAPAVDFLINKGADMNCVPAILDHQASGFHWACINGHIDTVRVFIEHGADLTVKDLTYQATPQGWAEQGGQTEIIALLEEFQTN